MGMWLRLSAVILYVLLPFNSQADVENKVFTVGVVPQFEAAKLYQIWRPILDQVEQKTGYRFKMRGSVSIPDFEREVLEGKFDFAYMNPYHMILAAEAAGYVPVIRDHGRKLYGVLVVRKDSEISKPEELNDKTLAFPSPNALGASLQMRQELHDKFDVKVKPTYVRTHDSVYQNVLLRETSAGGGVQKTFNQQKPQYKEMLRVIHTTEKVNSHPFAAHADVPEIIRDEIRTAFIELGKNNEGRKLLLKIPMKQVGVATIGDYQQLKPMRLERFYVAPN